MGLGLGGRVGALLVGGGDELAVDVQLAHLVKVGLPLGLGLTLGLGSVDSGKG